MISLIFIFTALLCAQIALGIFTHIHKNQLPSRYSYILSGLGDPATTLENYIKIYRNIGVKVNAQIENPAHAHEDFILIRKDNMYKNDLYTNLFLLTQLELTKKTYRLLRNILSIQNFLFIGGILIFVISISLDTEYSNYILYSAVTLHIIAISLSFIGMYLYEILFEEVLIVAQDLLDFDDLEFARAQKLTHEYKYRTFEYAIDLPIKILYFFKP